MLACLGLCAERFHKNLYFQGVIVLSCGWLAIIVTFAAVGLTKMRCGIMHTVRTPYPLCSCGDCHGLVVRSCSTHFLGAKGVPKYMIGLGRGKRKGWGTWASGWGRVGVIGDPEEKRKWVGVGVEEGLAWPIVLLLLDCMSLPLHGPPHVHSLQGHQRCGHAGYDPQEHCATVPHHLLQARVPSVPLRRDHQQDY